MSIRSVFNGVLDGRTGAVIYTAKTKNLATAEIIESCPYNIPRKSPDGTLAKCDMCYDRILNGLQPACVKVCPTGAMNFGGRADMLALASRRLAKVRLKFPRAGLLDADDLQVVYMVAHEPNQYHPYAVAANRAFDITRQVALKRMLRPISHFRAWLL